MECDRCFQFIADPDEHGVGVCPYAARPAGFGIEGDDIPGGVVVRHLTPEPFKAYSKTEIKRVANERGWVIAGDTPKNYSVAWSGVRKDKKPEEQ